MIEIIRHEIVVHPYTYCAAVYIVNSDHTRQNFDMETGEELPGYYGYGEHAKCLVHDWYGMGDGTRDKGKLYQACLYGVYPKGHEE